MEPIALQYSPASYLCIPFSSQVPTSRGYRTGRDPPQTFATVRSGDFLPANPNTNLPLFDIVYICYIYGPLTSIHVVASSKNSFS